MAHPARPSRPPRPPPPERATTRKAVLFCPECGHRSPVDGDWGCRTRDGDRVIACPVCEAVVTVRQSFDGDRETVWGTEFQHPSKGWFELCCAWMDLWTAWTPAGDTPGSGTHSARC